MRAMLRRLLGVLMWGAAVGVIAATVGLCIDNDLVFWVGMVLALPLYVFCGSAIVFALILIVRGPRPHPPPARETGPPTQRPL